MFSVSGVHRSCFGAVVETTPLLCQRRRVQSSAMFLRRNRRQKNGQQYEYWSLVESYRTERGPRQRVVATLGKLPGLDEDERVGWEEIARLLDGAPHSEAPEDLFGLPSVPAPPPHGPGP